MHKTHCPLSLSSTAMNLAACGGTFLTGLTGLTRFSYILYIQNIPSILSKKGNSYIIKLSQAPLMCLSRFFLTDQPVFPVLKR